MALMPSARLNNANKTNCDVLVRADASIAGGSGSIPVCLCQRLEGVTSFLGAHGCGVSITTDSLVKVTYSVCNLPMKRQHITENTAESDSKHHTEGLA